MSLEYAELTTSINQGHLHRSCVTQVVCKIGAFNHVYIGYASILTVPVSTAAVVVVFVFISHVSCSASEQILHVLLIKKLGFSPIAADVLSSGLSILSRAILLNLQLCLLRALTLTLKAITFNNPQKRNGR